MLAATTPGRPDRDLRWLVVVAAPSFTPVVRIVLADAETDKEKIFQHGSSLSPLDHLFSFAFPFVRDRWQ